MKRIQKDELYSHLSGFLKTKGVELQEGSYSRRIQQGCHLLADAINLSQRGLEKAKTEIDKGVERMRQVIHEKTAPKSAAAASANPFTAKTPPPSAQAPRPDARKRASAKPAAKRPKARGGAGPKRP